jgi:NAD(P)-dependent dehydrogenase (short-subunit alcohol dehydrogenase family)
MRFDLGGRVALVTGAGQGIGVGIARALADHGAAVVVNDLDPDRAEHAVAGLRRAGATARAVPFDVTDHDAAGAAISAAAAEHGPIDILVNNAGVPPGMAVGPFRDSDPAEWEPLLSLNTRGVMTCCRHVLGPMRERGHGRIITISSGAGSQGVALGVAAYGAGKGGAISFMRNLALEEARAGITANSVALGLMDNVDLDGSMLTAIARTLPVGRLGSPDDVGALCVYLASDEAAWMTGQTLELNGGSATS